MAPDTTLRLVHGRADLPPTWDGDPVAWDPWETHTPVTWSSWSLHAPLEQRACSKCGLLDGPTKTTVGLIDGTIRLHVTRCACGHDTAYDVDANELWDLDPDEDYGPNGSWPDTDGRLW